MSVDTLGSAGPSAQIPSRVGLHETETVLGSTHPNGSSLLGLAHPDGTLESSPLLDDPITGSKVLEDGFDINHERYYGPRRTAALVVLLIVIAGLGWAGLKWRRERRQKKWRSMKGKGRAIRLEETGYSSVGEEEGLTKSRGSRREVAPVEQMETVKVFDVGDEDETDEEELDEDAWGDLGRQADQYGDDGGNTTDEEKGLRGARRSRDL